MTRSSAALMDGGAMRSRYSLGLLDQKTLHTGADSAAKDTLDGDISVELIPFSDLKSRTNNCILELWQSEWEFPENKLYKIFPVLKECISCPRKNRKEETVMARLHIGQSFLTHSFC